MKADFANLSLASIVVPTARPRPHRGKALAVSLLLHLALLAVLGLCSVRPLVAPAPQAIDVDILPPSAAANSPPTPKPGEAAPPGQAAAVMSVGGQAAVSPSSVNQQPAAGQSGDGTIRPSKMLASAYIAEPASAAIRKALPHLAPEERATQICNIEAGQQIEAVRRGALVDTVHASALGDVDIEGLTVNAPSAGYRSARKWYRLSFVCTVSADYHGVASFAFKLGPPVPPSLWDDHGLNAADADE